MRQSIRPHYREPACLYGRCFMRKYAILKQIVRKPRLFYVMANHSDDLRLRCFSLRARAEEVLTSAAVMRDPQSQQAMFRMAHAYETMALLLEKTSNYLSSLTEIKPACEACAPGPEGEGIKQASTCPVGD